ncbi:MAG TPA: hypothetical protein PKD21_08475, partial [Candidatus Competibacter phosphatis]|nr:hypothetical protein [Candidatus Competibacter phosphatis]
MLAATASLDADQNAGNVDDTGPPPVDDTQPATAADPVVELPPCPTGDGGLRERVAVHICQQVRIEPPPTSLKVDHLALRSLEYLIPFYA